MIIDQLLLLYYYYYFHNNNVLLLLSLGYCYYYGPLVIFTKKILQVCQCETLACFALQRSSNLGAMFDKHILRSSSICARLRYLVLSAVSLAKPASHKYVDAKRRRILKAVAKLIIATQNDERGEMLTATLQLLFHVYWKWIPNS